MIMMRKIRITMMMILIPMIMMAVSPALHPLFSIYNDGGDDDDDDDATFAPSALGNRSSPPQSSPSYSATWQA